MFVCVCVPWLIERKGVKETWVGWAEERNGWVEGNVVINIKGKERKSKERKDRKGQDRTGQDRTGQDRTGQDRTGKERKGKERKGKERNGWMIVWY